MRGELVVRGVSGGGEETDGCCAWVAGWGEAAGLRGFLCEGARGCWRRWLQYIRHHMMGLRGGGGSGGRGQV